MQKITQISSKEAYCKNIFGKQETAESSCILSHQYYKQVRSCQTSIKCFTKMILFLFLTGKWNDC